MASRMGGVSGRPPMRDDVINDLVKENKQMKKMMLSLLSAVGETHPELLIKYSDFIADSKEKKSKERIGYG